MSEEEGEGQRRFEIEDQLDAPTQQLAESGASRRTDDPVREAETGVETATYSRHQAPPIPLEDLDTIVSAPAEAAGVPDAAAKSPLAPSSSLHPLLLERIEPSLGRGERLRLDAAHWRVSLGRAEHNDIRLYTESASRDHAVISGNEAGEWVLTPVEGKSVEIDGEAIAEPVVLEMGMNLLMGADHLRCVSEGLDRSKMAAQTSADLFQDEDKNWAARLGVTTWLIGGAALLGLLLIAFAWFGG